MEMQKHEKSQHLARSLGVAKWTSGNEGNVLGDSCLEDGSAERIRDLECKFDEAAHSLRIDGESPSGLLGNRQCEESIAAWFEREILAHEEALTRFISRLWSRKDDLGDVRQEAYLRVFEAALKAKPRSPKAFLFATARNLLIDQLRRHRAVSMQTLGNPAEAQDMLTDEISPERRVSDHAELLRLFTALDRLPARCREVVWLRRLHDCSQREIAERLGISEKAVEKHIHQGMRWLTELTAE